METATQRKSCYFRAASAFFVCLVAVFALPVIAIYGHSVLPDILTNYFFFSPQLLFPYEGLVTRDASGARAVFSHGVARTLTFVHWGFVGLVFTLATKRVPLRYIVPLAIVTIVCVGVVTHLAFGLFGVTVALDGP